VKKNPGSFIFMNVLFSLILTFSFNLQAQESECQWNALLANVPNAHDLERQNICDHLPPIKDAKDLKEVLEFFYDETQKNDDKDRHKATEKLNACSPHPSSKALVIAFEGTGGYEPMIPATMANFNKCFGGKIDPKLKDKLFNISSEILKAKKGRDSKWSGLERGIMSEMMTLKDSQKVDWYSFPSEEVEQLAGLEEFKNLSISQINDNIKDSVNSNPKGIQNARDCIKKYLSEARKLNIQPKIILTSHSSGGRSLVKFAEHMKKDVGVDVDLAFSIDPVIEAHHAVEEVIPQKIGEPARYAKWKIKEKFGSTDPYPYSAVWSRSQPSKLYKSSNIKKQINFYQKEDRLGLKMGGDAGRFGIQGSPVDGADNIFIKGVGIGGHGEINMDKKLLEKFRKEMELILK